MTGSNRHQKHFLAPLILLAIAAFVGTIALYQFAGEMLLGQFLSSVFAERISLSYQTDARLGEKTVAIGGGGAVTGIYIHPRQKDLVYVRTDVGGLYRWNPTTQAWIPLTEQFGRKQLNYFGGESIALDPTNPNVVYAAVGKSHWFGPGALLKSTNQGATWTKLNLELPLAKNYRRWVGERLAVNPFNSREILFGSWKDGLWRSDDAGDTWQPVKSFPREPDEDLNVSAIAFDPQIQGLVYAGVPGEGVYRSPDAGASWNRLEGSSRSIMRMAIARDGTLYTVNADDPGVSKYVNGRWQDITPPDSKPAFGSISINPADPRDILVGRGEKANPEIYRSLDGGQQWQELSRRTKSSVPWWTDFMRKMAWVAAIEFDPHVSGRVWLVDWFGIWRTDNINANPGIWTSYEQGHEEVVVFALAAPPKGPLLLSGVADVDGFVHDKGLDTYPTKSFSDTGAAFQDTYGIAYSESNPLHLVRIGGRRQQERRSGGATSTDGGLTWKEFQSFPEGMPTYVAMSATDPNLFVVTRSRSQPVRSTDGGATWNPVLGLPKGEKGPWNLPPQSLVADKVDGKTFYYYSEGKVYRSTDEGASFEVVNKDIPKNRWHTIQTLPGVKGEVWLSVNDEGLYRSTDAGKTFARIPAVEEAYLFDFGKSQIERNPPALYVYGKLSQQGSGIFRSLDLGKTWTRIGNPQRPIGNDPTVLIASRQKFGLVFVGTAGRGVYYGTR